MKRAAIGATALVAAAVSGGMLRPSTPEEIERFERDRRDREAEKVRKAEIAAINEARPLTRQQRRRLEKPWKKRRGGPLSNGGGDAQP